MPTKKPSPTKTSKSKSSTKPKVSTSGNTKEIKLEVFYMATLFIAICAFLLLAINRQSNASTQEMQRKDYMSPSAFQNTVETEQVNTYQNY